MSIIFTLTRRERTYRLGKNGRFYYFDSLSDVASFIPDFIKVRSEDDLVTITVETAKLKEEAKRAP